MTDFSSKLASYFVLILTFPVFESISTLLPAVMDALPSVEPIVLPTQSKVCSLLVVFSLLLPIVNPSPSPPKIPDVFSSRKCSSLPVSLGAELSLH